jgi:hypothetical protein
MLRAYVLKMTHENIAEMLALFDVRTVRDVLDPVARPEEEHKS